MHSSESVTSKPTPMMSHVNEYVNGQLKGQLTQTIIDVCEKA